MPTPIVLQSGEISLPGELNDSASARALAARLPLSLRLDRWGEEYYGALPEKLGLPAEAGARTEMRLGELAYWPEGDAFCVFFGPTPASRNREPRAYSPVNPIGQLDGDGSALKTLGHRLTAVLRGASGRPAAPS